MSSLKLLKCSVVPRLQIVCSRHASKGRLSFAKEAKRTHIKPSEYLLLVIPATTFGLGVWQVQRRQWKIDLLNQLKTKTSAPPVELPLDQNEVKKLEYKKVKVRGTYLHGNEIYIGPRSRVVKEESRGLLGTSENIGFHVIVPFELENGQGSILVNRGWVPKDKLTPQSRQEDVPTGLTELVGVVRMSEQRQQFTPKNLVDTNRWSSRDIDALANKLGTLPIFVDADEKSTVPKGPIGGQTRVTLRNDHLSYLLTWFSLSAVTLFMWVRKFAPK